MFNNLKKYPGQILLVCFFAVLGVTTSGAKALSGTYTIGGTGANYATFTNAVSDLTGNGISGPVIFNIAAGNYNETITIPAIAGSDSLNTITFNGSGTGGGGTRIYYSITSSGSSVIFLNQCSYVTVQNMTVENTSTSTTGYASYPAAIATYLDNHNIIKNCNIKVAVSTGGQYNVVGLFWNNCNHDTIENSHVSGGLFGIYNLGQSGSSAVSYGNSTVINNRFTGAYYNHIYGLASKYGLVNDSYIGNTFDSSQSPYISALQLSYENGATVRNNITNGNVASFLPIEIDYPNYGFDSLPFMIYNNMIGNFGNEGLYVDGDTTPNMNLKILHNTIDEENNSPSNIVYIDLVASGGITIENNIMSTNSAIVPFYLSTTGTPTNIIVNGNDYYNLSGALVSLNGTGYTSLASFQGAVSGYGWSLYDNNVKPNYVSQRNLRCNQSAPNPSGIYAGIKVDIDGNPRCLTFPTAGASESTYFSGNPVVSFTLPSKIYPNSPTYVYQNAKPGEPQRYFWYVNGALVSDSLVLFTNKFVLGEDTLKLVTITCRGSDSATQAFTVSAPTAVPVIDFVSDKNLIKSGDVVSFIDLSTNGPVRWLWSISPDSSIVNGVQTANYKFVYGSTTFQNPQVEFFTAGKYEVCLHAGNNIGNGSAVCKTNYIEVIPSYNLGAYTVVHDPSAYLYDNGGQNGNYTADKNVESILIDPCADSVYLTFSLFDLYCGFDYLRIYQGANNKGLNISGKCTTNGSYSGDGPGFTGGKAFPGCGFQCMPNVTKPDTFKAKSEMYIEMNCYEAVQSAGFAAYWWTKPRTGTKKPSVSFITSNPGDSVCVNGTLTFTNTSKIDSTDPSTFLWDLDGDLSTFECVGLCASAIYPYHSAGKVTVTLIATNCGGSDTASELINVVSPGAPKATFMADNPRPTTTDIVNLIPTATQCIDHYRWTITKSSGSGTVFYVNGTSTTSPNPQANFSDTGYYDVKLYVDNLNGAQKDSETILKYIHVHLPYCTPSVSSLNSSIGISGVVLNTIHNGTIQAQQGYSDFVADSALSTTLALGVTYSLSVSRNPNLVSYPINRTVYIDWNEDGNFNGPGEIIGSDSDSYSDTWFKNITVPKNAVTGATVMRIATNLGTLANKPCGVNQYGEYQDYRLYITPYNILPVITLIGTQGLRDTIKLQQGNEYIEPAGDSATSLLYGNITNNIIRTSILAGNSNPNDTFNRLNVATYVFSYNVTDSAGNKAITRYRVVELTKDTTPPDLIVALPDTVYYSVTTKQHYPLPIPKVISDNDLVNGPEPVTIDSSTVKTNVLGTYIVTYSSQDKSGNKIKVYRTIIIVDSIKPVLTLNGNDTMKLEVKTHFKDPGVKISDTYYPLAELDTLLKIKSNLDTAKLGTYTIVYTVTDPSGNRVSVTRIIIVFDTIRPSIILNGFNPDSIAVFGNYKDPGAIVSDNYDTISTWDTSGTFYKSFPGGINCDTTGKYTIIYSVKDKSGNSNSVTRTVKVQDRTAPSINLIGPATVQVCRWAPYKDSGYVVHDNYDSVKQLRIDTLGNYYRDGGTTVEQLLYIQYWAIDKAGNVGKSGYRYITILPAGQSPCTSGIEPYLDPDKYISIFPNPTSGIFTVNANLPGPENVRISVTDMLGGEITVISDGILTSNSFRVDLSSQASGIYFLNIISGNQTLTKRIEVLK